MRPFLILPNILCFPQFRLRSCLESYSKIPLYTLAGKVLKRTHGGEREGRKEGKLVFRFVREEKEGRREDKKQWRRRRWHKTRRDVCREWVGRGREGERESYLDRERERERERMLGRKRE